MSIRGEFGHACAVYDAHHELVRMQEEYHDATDDAARYAIGERIEVLILAEADHLEASRLARAVTALPTPGELRRQAGLWRERAGDGPGCPGCI